MSSTPSISACSISASSDFPAGSTSTYPDRIEHPRDAAALAEAAFVPAKEKAQLARGAIAIVGRRIHDHRYAVRTVTFVANLFDFSLAALPGAASDGAFDVLLRHIELARFFDRHFQAVVCLGIGRATLGGEDDLLAQLREERAPLGVDFALLQLDVMPLRMSGHDGKPLR